MSAPGLECDDSDEDEEMSHRGDSFKIPNMPQSQPQPVGMPIAGKRGAKLGGKHTAHTLLQQASAVTPPIAAHPCVEPACHFTSSARPQPRG